MSNYDNGYLRAQRQYDAQMPPDDGCDECPACEGTGKQGEGDEQQACPRCKGEGVIDLAAEKAERRAEAEEARYDARRDDELMKGL